MGSTLVGVDPSAVSIEAAREHAAASGLTIDYRVGAGEQLPLGGAQARGLYLFDTVNRTLQSKLVAIKIAQEWPLTRVVDTPMHDWQMFIKPAELTRTLHRHGLHLGEIAGLGPRAKMPTVLRSFISASKGRITYGECSLSSQSRISGSSSNPYNYRVLPLTHSEATSRLVSISPAISISEILSPCL